MDCLLAVRQQAAGRCAPSCQLSSMSSLFASRSYEHPATQQVPPAPHATAAPASCSTHSVSLVWHELNGRWHQLHGKLCIFFSSSVTSLIPVGTISGAEEDMTFENGKRRFLWLLFQEIQVTATLPPPQQLHSTCIRGHCSVLDWKTSGDITWLHTIW